MKERCPETEHVYFSNIRFVYQWQSFLLIQSTETFNTGMLMASTPKRTLVILFATRGTAVAQWLRQCATNQKVAGSNPDGVMEFFNDINKSFWSHYGPGVDSASNRNEYQEYFLGVNVAGA
jgi:hypothetical protein